VAVAPEGFQIKATDAVAAAIWACVAHWEGSGQDAVIASVHYGGDTDTIACMASGCVVSEERRGGRCWRGGMGEQLCTSPGMSSTSSTGPGAVLWCQFRSPLTSASLLSTGCWCMAAGALVGARDGCAWLPEQWLAQMERDAAGTTFFNMPAVQKVLSQQAGSTAQQQQGTELVCCTKYMGRKGAVVLSQLLAQLDCRGP
jgi:hypothetical protein